jgi:hypothetical protein
MIVIQKTILLIGRKGLEPSTALATEFTAQPVIPTNGTFLCIYNYIQCIFNFNQSRAISTTRTIFRLNTNQSHAYEDLLP